MIEHGSDAVEAELRLASLDDLELLVQLRMSYLAETFDALNQERSAELAQQLHTYCLRQLNQSFFAVIAFIEYKVAATAFLVVDERPGNPIFMNGRIGTIMNVYTYPQYRQRGVATQVMEAILDIAKEQNLSRLDLKATHAGIPLYEKLGFNQTSDEYVSMFLQLK